MYARPISWTTGFNETSRILCTRTLQTSCSPWPCHCCCAFQEGKMGEGGIYSLRHRSRPLGANLATKRRASIWDLGHAPCLQHGMKERVVWCHVQWPRDPLTNLSPSCCSKITRLRSCTNNSSNGSLFYRPPSSPLLFSFLPSNWKGEGSRQRDSSIEAVKFVRVARNGFNLSAASKWAIYGRGIFEYSRRLYDTAATEPHHFSSITVHIERVNSHSQGLKGLTWHSDPDITR